MLIFSLIRTYHNSIDVCHWTAGQTTGTTESPQARKLAHKAHERTQYRARARRATNLSRYLSTVHHLVVVVAGERIEGGGSSCYYY